MALLDWLPLVLQPVVPWVSTEDIRKGSRWTEAMDRGLRQAESGIICLTTDNVASEWLHFEAGAISNALPGSSVWTLLIDGLSPQQVHGPLSQFQHTRFEKADVRRLVNAINLKLGNLARPARQLDELFERLWPDLESRITDAIQAQTAQSGPKELKIAELAGGSELIAGHVFEDVILVGPAIVLPERCEFGECIFEFNGSIESILWPLDLDRRSVIVGVFGIVRCRFLRCTFRAIGFCGPEGLLNMIRQTV